MKLLSGVAAAVLHWIGRYAGSSNSRKVPSGGSLRHVSPGGTGRFAVGERVRPAGRWDRGTVVVSGADRVVVKWDDKRGGETLAESELRRIVPPAPPLSERVRKRLIL